MTSPVKRRKVFYIPGYDPFHPRRYRELFRSESALQAQISGYRISLTGGTDREYYGWRVAATVDDFETATEFEVLVWSDIVRNSMNDSILATYLQLCKTVAIYVGSGAIFRLARLRKGPTIAALYPIALLAVQLGLAVGAFFLGVALVGEGLKSLFVYTVAGSPGPIILVAGTLLPVIFGLVLALAVLGWFRAKDKWFYAYYLMHDYAFTAQLRGANPPELERRMADFGRRIRTAMEAKWDEVLVVGHSSGAHIAVSVLADLMRSGGTGAGTAMGFLSLGQVVPMASFLPQAQRLRGDLAYLSTSDDVTWVDVTAPGDGCAFALCDPVSVTGVAPANKRWPLVISAAFTQTLSERRWRQLRWRFFRLHFQYLCAFDRPGDYDYFLITAGPMTLADRFRGRVSSQSRIEIGHNRYRDVA